MSFAFPKPACAILRVCTAAQTQALLRAAAILLWAHLAACATGGPGPPVEAPVLTAELRDFSGNWEKNYQLSDDFNTRFGLYIADIQRRFSQSQGNLQGGPLVVGGGGVNVDAINGLARFTEEITRTPLLEITQDAAQIEIEREDDFALRCAWKDRQFVRSVNAFGSDVCGWNDERLMFRMSLGGGLHIAHQLSLSPDTTLLNVTTTVTSDAVAVPMVVSNFYQRYTRPGEDYDCVLTLTRNTVCSQSGRPDER